MVIENHIEDKPKTNFTPKRNLKEIKNKVYRIIKLSKENVTPISVPYILDEGGTLFLMNENQEIRCIVPPDTKDKQIFKLSDGRNVYMCSLIRYEY